ncbi:unnamed protein product [Eruca vesicaria subsp. sativa]|uniref:Uncharacterized protein n=1 Tax=Eruca vesicaria subsp. sativa TaxID=29727 RepID=A0ABC8LT99_ERUVS|nr:unnamed protein product [Eruca vesicaria subsp. sativa]
MPSIVIARNHASGQNLVDSTKLERIVIDSKTASLKKDKKERKHRKEKREKSHKHSSKKADDVLKKQLCPSSKSPVLSEKSDVTEELEGPQNHLGYLSDGSQNSKKRKRDVSPPAVESLIKAAPVADKPLRIRLIFKKPKVESPPLPREDVVSCSTHRAKTPQAVICSKVCEPELNVPSTSGSALVESKKICEPELNVPSTSSAAIAGTMKRKKHKPSKEDRYNALFDDWTPLTFTAMEVDTSSKNDDEDWLFGSKTKERTNCKAAVKIDEDVSTSSDSSWPKAQFLPQVGIYSLPYTVPF